MTTTAEKLTDAIEAIAEVAQKYGETVPAIDRKISDLIPSVTGTLVRDIYIDPIGGNDNNAGTNEMPLRSLDAIPRLTCRAGDYRVFLMGDVNLATRVVIDANTLVISGWPGATRRRINYANQIDGISTLSPHLLLNNRMACIAFRHVIFGNTVASPHITKKRMVSFSAFAILDFFDCEFDTQPGDDLRVVSLDSHLVFRVAASIYTAAQEGLWMEGTSAGDHPSAFWQIVRTNLVTI